MAPKQKRYWAGKAPEWAEVADDAAPVVPAPAPAAAAPTALPPPAAGGAAALDPRLARLTQRQPSERRTATEAAVVVRRRHRSPSAEASPARRASPPAAAARAAAEEAEEEDEEAAAARRQAIRARQLAAEAAAAAASGSDEGSEESSEYESEEESEEEGGIVMLKPAFVPKTERETVAEREALLAAAEQTTRQEEQQLEERRRQTQELVAAVQAQEAQQGTPVEGGDSDLNTEDDEGDEVAQYEAWRERELARIARDRHLRQAGNKAEAAAAAGPSGAAAAATAAGEPPKKKWKFLQKYWHKGAFFQGEGEEGEDVLGGIMQRDYDAPTGEDRFDRQLLPKIMQVRQFGRRGRTKWQHLLAEDTTLAPAEAPDASLPARQPRAVQQDFAKPRTHKT